MDSPWSYTAKRWFLLGSVSLGAFTSTMCASLHTSFYPQLAEKRGAAATEYGLVFGIYELVAFLSCPVYGKYMGSMGAERLLKSGFLVTGVSTMLFGLLDLTDDYSWFMSLSYLLRIIESLGSAAIITASLSLVVVVFSSSFARAFSLIQVFQGLGYMLAPTIGGFLFEIGGFWCPFVTVGVSILLSGMLIFLALLTISKEESQNKPLESAIWPVLKVVPVFLDNCCLAIQAASVGFVVATLEPHLRKFNLGPTSVGSMFIINSLIYSLASPVVGFLCDKHFNTKAMIIFGGLANIAGLLLIGPMPYIPVHTSLWMVGVGMGCVGLGMSLTHVPAIVDALSSAVKHGLPDDITTYAVISGISESMTSLGAFIGPSVAGILFDAVGFRRSSLFVVAVNLLLIAAMVWLSRIENNYTRIRGLNCTNSSLNTRLDGNLESTLMIDHKPTRQDSLTSLLNKH